MECDLFGFGEEDVENVEGEERFRDVEVDCGECAFVEGEDVVPVREENQRTNGDVFEGGSCKDDAHQVAEDFVVVGQDAVRCVFCVYFESAEALQVGPVFYLAGGVSTELKDSEVWLNRERFDRVCAVNEQGTKTFVEVLQVGFDDSIPLPSTLFRCAHVSCCGDIRVITSSESGPFSMKPVKVSDLRKSEPFVCSVPSVSS
jgi:hypothetical protein